MKAVLDSTPPEVSRTDVLRTLSLASDLGVGLAPHHGLRACYIALRIAEHLGLDAAAQRDVVEVALLKNAGCTSWTTQVAAMIRGDEIAARREMLYVREFGEMREVVSWAAKFVGVGSRLPARVARIADFMVSGRDFMREGFESGGEVACRIGERLGASENARRGLSSLFEQWNGKGMPRGLRGDAIPIAAYNLPFMHAYGVLNDALEAFAQEQGLGYRGRELGKLLAETRAVLAWNDFELIREGQQARNAVAHQGELLSRADCWKYIDAIEVELRAWACIPLSGLPS